MYKALEARSKLVRWRAVRFLNEVGDHTALAPLHRAAESEEEFDVRMEIGAAIAGMAWPVAFVLGAILDKHQTSDVSQLPPAC